MINNANTGVLIDGQRWKLYFSASLLVISAIVYLAADIISGLLVVQNVVIIIASSLVAVMGLVLMLYSVRCPHCGLRLVPYAMSTQHAGYWLNWVLTVNNCPKCNGTNA